MSNWLFLEPSLDIERPIEESSQHSESLSWKGEKPPSGTLADDWANNNSSSKWLHYEKGEWLDKLRDELYLSYPELSAELSFHHSENGVIWPIGSEMKCTCPSDFCSEAAKAGFYQIYLSISDKTSGHLMAKAEVEIVQEMTWTDTWSWKFGLAAIKKAELCIYFSSFKTGSKALCKALDNFLLDLATIHLEGLGRWEIFNDQ